MVWLPDRNRPENDLERYLVEKDFLSYILMIPAASADEKKKASDALAYRLNNQAYHGALNKFVNETISKGTLDKLKLKHKNDAIVPPPELGTDDTVPISCYKEFSIASGSKVYSGPSGVKAEEGILQQILQAAYTAITSYNLSAKGAFTLIRSSFKGSSLDLLGMYERNNLFHAFFRLVQLLAKSNSTPSQTLQEIIRLTNVRPEASELGKTFYRLLGLHEDLVSGLPAAERRISFQNTTRNNLVNYISLWYPSEIEQVQEKYEAFKMQSEREVRQLKQQGKIAEAQERQQMFCPVSSFIEAAMSILPFHTPVRAIREETSKKIHVAKVTENDLHLGAEATNWNDIMENEKMMQAQSLPPPPPPMVPGPPPFLSLAQSPMQPSSIPPMLQYHPYYQQLPMQQPPAQWMSPHVMVMGANAPPPPQQHSFPGMPRMQPGQGQGAVYQQPRIPQGPPPLQPRQQPQGQLYPSNAQPGSNNGRNGNGRRKNQDGKPKCPRCLRHDLYDNGGNILPCYRYPTVSQQELTLTCGHCGGCHYDARCNDHLRLKDIYPTDRPDRAPAAAPQMFSNSSTPPQPQPYQRGLQQGQPRGNNGRYNQDGYNQGRQGPLNGPRDRLRQPLPDPRIPGQDGGFPQHNQGFGGARPKQPGQNPF